MLRSAARAALDLIGTERVVANTCQPRCILKTCPQQPTTIPDSSYASGLATPPPAKYPTTSVDTRLIVPANPAL